jgi:YD repeat-containing protein
MKTFAWKHAVMLISFFLLSILFCPIKGHCGGVISTPTEAAFTNALAGGGVVTFACDGTITLASSTAISTNTTIDATGHFITISGGTQVQIFFVQSGASLTLSNLTIANGMTTTNGGAVYNAGSLLAWNCAFTSNQAMGTDGANGHNSGSGSGGNGSAGGNARGGAIYNIGTLTLTGCTFHTNSAIGGMGGAGGSGVSGGIGAAGGTAAGGAIFSTNVVSITNCTFSDNVAASGPGGSGGAGGGAGLGGMGGKSSVATGGAAYIRGNFFVFASTFNGNSAFSSDPGPIGGGGDDGDGYTLPSAPSGADCYGGAVYNLGTNIFVNSTFYANSATGANGADNFYGNPGDGGDAWGGALYSSNSVTVTNCTFSFNGAYFGAGGTQTYTGGHGTKGKAHGAVDEDRGPFVLKNSIIAYSLSGTNGFASISGTNGVGTFTDSGNNISSDRSISLSGTSVTNTNPLLNTLANNGGPTATCALLGGSPAIDNGDDNAAPTYDQRSFMRLGHSDIGAYEYGGSTFGVVALGPTASLDGDVGLFLISALPTNAAAPFQVNFTISGTASNGVDFQLITNSVTIPAGSSYAEVLVQGIPGAFTGTNKSVALTLLQGTNFVINPNDPLNPNSAMVTLYDHSTYDSSKRYVRGTSTAPDFQSFVIPISYETGVRLDDIGGNATNLFPGNLWTNTLYHFNATNLVFQTNITGRIPFQNPIVAFGDSVGGSPLYLNRNYSFGTGCGYPSSFSNALRIQVYYRSNSAYAGTISMPIPNPTITNQLTGLVTNGFTQTFTDFGLQTVMKVSPFFDWGLQSGVYFVFTHNASPTATNYYYVVEENGKAPYNYLVLNQSGTNDWSRLYVMEFSPFPSGISTFIDQPHFDGVPLPPAYQGKTLQELTNVIATLPDLSFLTPSNYLTLDDSPELRRHPILDQFVSDMGNDPLALANYVINEIGTCDAVDYNTNYSSQAVINLGGIDRSALATFQEGEGSPMEQCALLVYLLRQSGVPAAYAFPTNNGLQMLNSQVSKLLHVQLQGAVNELGQTNIPQLISVNYPWVAAYIGTNWVQIFPWLKDTEITEGFDLYDYMPTNYNSGYKWLTHFIANDTNIFSLSSSDQPLDLLPLFIQSSLNQNYPGMSVSDLGLKITNRRHLYAQWSDLPKPFALSGTPTVIESFGTNSSLFNTLEVKVYSEANPTRAIDTTEMRIADLHNRMLLLKFQEVGGFGSDLHNMILSLEPYSTNYTNVTAFSTNANPCWKLVTTNQLDSTDDSIVFQVTHRRLRFLPQGFTFPTGSTTTNLFSYNYFEVNQESGGGQTFQMNDHFRKGDLIAFCFNLGKVSEKMLDVHAQQIWQYNQNVNTNNPSTLDPDIYLGETTYLMGMSYFNYVDKFIDLDSQLHKVSHVSWYQQGYGLLRPLRNASGGLWNNDVFPIIPAVHMPYNGLSTLFNSSARADSGRDAYSTSLDWFLQLGVQGSAAEHGTLQSYYVDNAISTVKLLQQFHTNTVAMNAGNYLAAGQVLYNGIKLQDSDPGTWATIANFFSSGDFNREAFMTPGIVTNGTYVGVGALLVSDSEIAALVSGLNGGYADAFSSDTFSANNSPNLTVGAAPNGSVTPFFLFTASVAQNQGYLVDGATPSWTLPTTYNNLQNGSVQLDPTFAQAESTLSATYGTSANAPNSYVEMYNSGTADTAASANNDKSNFVQEPVNVLSGEFYVDASDLTLPGPMPLEIGRNYSSQNLAENEFGFGWKINYVPFLSLGTNSTLIYAAEMDGSFIAYRKSTVNTNLWTPQPKDNPTLNNHSSVGIGSTGNLFNNRLQLSTASGTNVYTLTGADGSIRTFTTRSYPVGTFTRSRPYLDKWQDSRGNSYAFQYGNDSTQPDYGEVRRIQSSNGNFLGFYYDVYGHITEAYTGDGRRLVYDYDKFGDLTTVTEPDESQISYAYQHLNSVTNSVTNVYSTHLIIQELKPDGRQVQNVYDSQRRVTNQLATAGVDLNPIRTARFVYTNNYSLSSPTNQLTGATWIYDYTNNVTSYFYTNSLIRKAVDPLGGTIVEDWYETNSPGGFQRSLKSVTDKRGLQTAYLYDSFGNPTNITVTGDLSGSGNTSNAVTTATYNTNNLPLSITDPVGNGVTVVYDTNFVFLPQQIIKFAGATKVSTNFSFFVDVTNVATLGSQSVTNTAFGMVQRQIRAFGSSDAATNDVFYNGQGFATNAVRYTGTDGTGDRNVTNSFIYDERGNLVRRTDAAGRSYVFNFDPMGRPTLSEAYDIGQTQPMDWTYTYYNDNGEVTWMDGPRFNPEDYIFRDYDGAGRVTTEIDWQSEAKPDGTGVQAKSGYNLYAQAFSQYDPLGDLTKITDPRGNYSLKHYDSIGQLVREEFYDSAGTLLSTNGFVRNLAGDVTNVFNPLGGKTQKQYTGTGKPAFLQNPDGSTNAWRYYVDGRIRREIQRNGAFWETTYDDANRTITKIFYSSALVPLSTNVAVLDRRGNVVERIDAAGNVFTTTFDGLDRPKASLGPVTVTVTATGMNPDSPTYVTNLLQQATTNFYDPAGLAVTNENALGEKVITSFDPISRPTLIQYLNSNGTLVKQTAYYYSSDHNSVTTTNGTGSTAVVSTDFTDTENHDVLSVVYPSGNSSQFSRRVYDSAGNRVSEIQQSTTNGAVTTWQTTSYVFDGLNRPLTQTALDNAVTTFAYDAASDLTNRAMPGNLSWSATYNNAGQISAENDSSGGQNTRNVSYTYYSVGNQWAGLLSTSTDNRAVTRTNAYDDYLRVANVATSGALPEQQMACSWQYDVRGFVTNITQSFADTNTGLTTTIQRAYDGYGQLVSESVSPGGTVAQGWDTVGRRTFSGNEGFQYQADGQMTSVNGSRFGYDLNGLLIGRTNGLRSMTISQRDGAGRPLQATTVFNTQTILSETWSWTGDGMPASYVAARSDFTDSRQLSYASLTRRLNQETLNLNGSQTITNNYAFDNGATGGLGVLTKAGQSSGTSNSWSGGVDAFSRISSGTNSVIHRTAVGAVNGAATLRGYLNGQSLPLNYDPHSASTWFADLPLNAGTNTFSVYADHPSGLFTTNRNSTFTVSAGSFDNEQSLYDGSGNVTNRIWKRADGAVVKTQNLIWDAFGRLVKVTERDATNNGFNFTSVFDGLGRQVQTIETSVSNNVALVSNPAPVVVTYTYDPQVEFLIEGIGITQGNFSRQDLLAYGPDLSGHYGGMQGVGGLEAISSTVGTLNTTALAINDCFGNVLGAITNGAVGWNSARLNLYAPVEGYAPPRLSLDVPTYTSLAWRTRPVTAGGFVQLGARPYDWTRRAFLSADPLGHASDPALNVAFGGNPASYFDPDGRMTSATLNLDRLVNDSYTHAMDTGLGQGLLDWGVSLERGAASFGLKYVFGDQIGSMLNIPAQAELTDIQNSAQTAIDQETSKFNNTQGTIYASSGFVGEVAPNFIPIAGEESAGAGLLTRFNAWATEKAPVLGTDVGTWLGFNAEKVAPQTAINYENWGGEFINDMPYSSGGQSTVNQLPPVVIGEDMRNRVIPFAQQNGFDYYKPGPSLGNQAADLAANQAWMQGIVNQGRIVIDIGRAPGRVDPSVFYLAESEIVNQNAAPVISFSGFSVQQVP